MVRATMGFRRSTRRKLKKSLRHKFKVTPYLREFKAKDKVVIKLDPSSHKGMPFPKFKGATGVIKEKRGDAYIVEITVGKSTKKVISRPEHLVALKK
jgi:large subunit ribosomal protein L21e